MMLRLLAHRLGPGDQPVALSRYALSALPRLRAAARQWISFRGLLKAHRTRFPACTIMMQVISRVMSGHNDPAVRLVAAVRISDVRYLTCFTCFIRPRSGDWRSRASDPTDKAHALAAFVITNPNYGEGLRGFPKNQGFGSTSLRRLSVKPGSGEPPEPREHNEERRLRVATRRCFALAGNPNLFTCWRREQLNCSGRMRTP
jgi:hypothetical protein